MQWNGRERDQRDDDVLMDGRARGRHSLSLSTYFWQCNGNGSLSFWKCNAMQWNRQRVVLELLGWAVVACLLFCCECFLLLFELWVGKVKDIAMGGLYYSMVWYGMSWYGRKDGVL